jgi:fumarylpyruvate hydrolase
LFARLGGPRGRLADAFPRYGATRASGDLRNVIWSVDEIIATLSAFVEPAPGDWIFTGTPSGVGPMLPGQTVHGMIAGVEPIEVKFHA